MKLLIIALTLTLGLGFSSCHKGPSCPAYKSVGNNPFMVKPDEPGGSGSAKDNKRKVEKKKKEQLSRKNSRAGRSSLFPKSFGVKSR